MLVVCSAVVGCDGNRDLTEYNLDENSFDAEAMVKIEQESGLDLPDDAKGLAFCHIPPIDPIVFAKIEIPARGKIRCQIFISEQPAIFNLIINQDT